MAAQKYDLEFNSMFLNCIVFHSIQNDTFLKKIRQKFDLSNFRSKERKYIMQMVYDYFDDYKKAPKDDFFNLFKEQENDMNDDLYNKCINLISVIKDITGSNWEYVVNRIDESIRHFRLEEASIEFATLIKRKKYDEAKACILKAMKDPTDVESDYFDFFEDKEYIEKRLQEVRYKMKTGINSLDKVIGGFNPTWLITILGATKSGKSWILIELAIAGVLQGLNVLFVSLEMDKTVVKSRFDQTIGFLSSRDDEKLQDTMVFTNGHWEIKQEEVESIYNIPLVEKNTQRLKKISGGGLKIMAFHRGRVNYRDIDLTLDSLEEDGFIVDLLVVDYLGIMKETDKGQSKKDRISENCLGLKEICGKRKMIGATAMQGNRKAMTAKTFTSVMVADDIDTIFHSDMVLALCQTKKEEEQSKIRLYLANSRHGKQHASIGLIRDLTIGQMAVGEWEVTDDFLKDEKEDSDGTTGGFF